MTTGATLRATLLHKKASSQGIVFGGGRKHRRSFPSYFIPSGVSARCWCLYRGPLEDPWMREVASQSPFIFQQDSALAHSAKKAFLKEEGVHFWMPQQWPPNSPDLNPLDYAICSMVAQGTCKDGQSPVTQLKRKVSRCWRNLNLEKIHSVCRKFQARLERCIAKNGSFFVKKSNFSKQL